MGSGASGWEGEVTVFCYSGFVTVTRTEVVSGGASEGKGREDSEEEAVPSRGLEGCHTSAAVWLISEFFFIPSQNYSIFSS